MEKLETVKSKIVEYHIVAKEIVGNACHTALIAKNFVLDERIVSDSKGKKTAN